MNRCSFEQDTESAERAKLELDLAEQAEGWNETIMALHGDVQLTLGNKIMIEIQRTRPCCFRKHAPFSWNSKSNAEDGRPVTDGWYDVYAK